MTDPDCICPDGNCDYEPWGCRDDCEVCWPCDEYDPETDPPGLAIDLPVITVQLPGHDIPATYTAQEGQ